MTDNVTTIRRPAGYFALQSGDLAVLAPDSKRVVSDELLKLEAVAGLTIRAPWNVLAPKKGKFDLSFFARQTAHVRGLGKSYKLLVMTGEGCAPEWLDGEWYAGAPLPWSPRLAEEYRRLVELLGGQFAADPACVGVHVTGPTYPSAEMHPAPRLGSRKGYSRDKMIAAWRSSIEAYAAAFPKVGCCLSISVKEIAKGYVDDVVADGRRILGARFGAQHNALKAGTEFDAPHQRLVAKLAAEGVWTGYEMACSAAATPVRFGAADVMRGITLGRAAGGRYFDVYPQDLSRLRLEGAV